MTRDGAAEVRFDWLREARTGIPEAVYCEGKSTRQLTEIAAEARARGRSLLFTRLSAAAHAALAATAADLDYDPVSRTAIFGPAAEPALAGLAAVVCAGSSDLPPAIEAQRALEFSARRRPSMPMSASPVSGASSTSQTSCDAIG